MESFRRGSPLTSEAWDMMRLSDGVQPRVLVVDDEPGIVAALREALAYWGYAVSTAQDGLQALDQVKAAQPHVVILDINMPGMDGMDVLRHLRTFDPEVGVIMVSAQGDEETRQTALTLGAADYLRKPMRLEEVERSVARRLVTRVLRETLRSRGNEHQQR
jgi:DNA-binding response OmpR family regulator